MLILRDFNPRTHVGCDVDALAEMLELVISIHAPTWGATSFVGYRCCDNSHFNPRTHVGCDLQHKIERQWSNISIHAPTWGATRIKGLLGSVIIISIHAPTWGATVKPSNDWLLGHKDNEFANENIIIINSVNIT